MEFFENTTWNCIHLQKSKSTQQLTMCHFKKIVIFFGIVSMSHPYQKHKMILKNLANAEISSKVFSKWRKIHLSFLKFIFFENLHLEEMKQSVEEFLEKGSYLLDSKLVVGASMVFSALGDRLMPVEYENLKYALFAYNVICVNWL